MQTMRLVISIATWTTLPLALADSSLDHFRQLRGARQQGTETAHSPATAESLLRPGSCPEAAAEKLTCSDITSVGLTVSWPSVPDAAAYLLDISHRVPNGSAWMPFLTETTSTPCSNVQDLLPGSDYQFSIRAVSSKWPGAWQPWKTYGAPLSCRTAELTASQAWVLPPNETSPSAIHVRFRPPAEMIGLTGFQVRWNATSSESIMVNDSWWATITGLTPASAFAVQVTPIYGQVHGQPSDPVLYRTSNQSLSWFYAYRGSDRGDKGGFVTQANTLSAARAAATYFHGNKNSALTQWCIQRSSSDPWADYVSCNHEQCVCMLWHDRCNSRVPHSSEICRRPYFGVPVAEAYKKAFRGESDCDCSEESAKRSATYIGRAPRYNTDAQVLFASGSEWSPLSDKSPASCKESDSQQIGFYYSFPGHTECPLGESVGSGGCTWGQQPMQQVIGHAELVDQILADVGGGLDRLHQLTKEDGTDFIQGLEAAASEQVLKERQLKMNTRCCGC